MCTRGLTTVPDTIIVIEALARQASTKLYFVDLNLDPSAYKSVANQSRNFNSIL